MFCFTICYIEREAKVPPACHRSNQWEVPREGHGLLLILLFLGLSEFSQKRGHDRRVETKKRNRENDEKRKLRILAWR